MKETVARYFDRAAGNYQKSRTGNWLGRLVRAEEEQVLALLAPKGNEEILDAGCGSGYFSMILKQLGAKPYGIDISREMVRILVSNGSQGSVADIENFNLGRKFDKILCAGALEFTGEAARALECFDKHLKAGGVLVILYPRKSFFGYLYKLYHLLHGVAICLFSESYFATSLAGRGFRIDASKHADCITSVIKAVKIV